MAITSKKLVTKICLLKWKQVDTVRVLQTLKSMQAEHWATWVLDTMSRLTFFTLACCFLLAHMVDNNYWLQVPSDSSDYHITIRLACDLHYLFKFDRRRMQLAWSNLIEAGCNWLDLKEGLPQTNTPLPREWGHITNKATLDHDNSFQ
jgi:hypothetical protein